MKRFKLLILILPFLGACKKKDLVTGDFRLMQISENNATNNKIVITFDYDGAGRLQKKSYSNNSNPYYRVTDFIYSGNEIFIKSPLTLPGEQNEIKYSLDGMNRPTRRKSFSYIVFTPPEGPQKKYQSDSTNFEYRADGRMIKYSGVATDSLSYYPSIGILETRNIIVTYSALYEISDANLKSVTRALQQDVSIKTQGGPPSLSRQLVEEKTEFIYDKLYPNIFDFKNAYLIQELGDLPYPLYSFDSHFKNFPNKAVTTRVFKTLNGSIISTTVINEEPALIFDPKGYILSKIVDPQALKQVFSYKRV